MLDWLKPILGDGYNEEIDNKIAAEINKGFVAKADYDAAKDAQRTAAEALADANKALAEYKDTDIDGLRKSAEEWQAKAEQAEKDADARVAAVQFDAKLDSAIIKAHVLEECDPLSAEVSINTLNLTLFNQEGRFSILNPEGYFDVLQHRQKLTVWEDVRRSAHDTSTTSYCMGTFYLDDWSNEDDTLADFTAIDTIGLLDGSPFDGGVYDTHVASLAAEILSGYPYTLDSVLGEERIQGYIPAGTRREALQQLAFAIGAVVDCSRGEIIRIVPAPQRASGLIGTDRRLQDGSKVTLLTLVTAVSVTAHRYIPGEASEELYKDTLEPGTYRVTFDAPAVADSLAVRGAELSERGVNHCTLTVSKAAEVCVTGRKYSDSATVLRREASNLPSNAQGNEVSVPDATLVSPDRAAAVAARVLDYYAQRYEQTFRMVAGDEKLADRLIVESFGGEMVRGVVTKLEFDLTGGFLADAKIVGRKLSNNAAAYAGEEIHAGERSFI